jgi:putative FmdB family regulatory protein
MPTYDYTCAACGHRFERFESINDGGVKPCPKCGKKKAKRMLGTGAGLIFKGAGFYTTDSKTKPSSGEDSGSATGDSDKKAEPKDKKKKEEKESKK